MSTDAPTRTLWFDGARARRFLVPDDAELPPGGFSIRTSLGRERTVDEAALAPFEVTAEEARAWSKEQLGAVLGEVRGKALGFVERLRERTAGMREENRKAWERGVADAPGDVRAAAEKVREGLRDLGEALQRAAHAHGAATEEAGPPAPADASAGAEGSAGAQAAEGSAGTSGETAPETAGEASAGTAADAESGADAGPPPDARCTEKPLTGASGHPNIAGPER
jgi:hypothetical protein